MEILGLYSKGYNKQFYLREIGVLTKIPLKTTQNTISQLEQKKVLKSTAHGRNKYFRLNLGNALTKFYLLQAELHKTRLFLKKYPLFNSFIKELQTTALIVVFGSFAKFTATKDSDLDMLVVSKGESMLPLHLLPYNAHQVVLSEKSFPAALKTGEPLIKEIEENHVILNNHSFYVDTMWRHYGKQQT